MKKLPCILILLSNLLLLSSEHNIEYKKDTCHRTYYSDKRLLTDAERQSTSECTYSRFEAYDKITKDHIAHISYDGANCHILYLHVDELYRRKGIGTKLTNQAIEDMRKNNNCQKIDLISARSAEKFWEKLGAKPEPDFTHVFSDLLSNNKSTN